MDNLSSSQENKTIPIDKQIASFRHHIDCNDRILLSARFGDGKTYFLNQFKQDHHDFIYITIYPINYQVENNTSILDLIKRDIIYQLLAKGLITDKVDFTAIYNALFDKKTLKELAAFLSKSYMLCNFPLGNYDSIVDNAINAIENICNIYDENRCNTKKYLKHFNKQSGIYESDCYTLLIKETLNQLRKDNKKTVLIIEDLDRIDPEHVFRILNVFSAHIDRSYVDLELRYQTDLFTNKFGFDKIIMVCDYTNLKRLFVYRYGSENLFGGYISKCVTNMPFCYSLADAKVDHAFDRMSQLSNMSTDFLKKIPELNQLLGDLSVREILSLFDKIDEWIPNEVFKDSKISKQCSLTRMLVVIKRLVGDKKELYEPILEKLKYENPKEAVKLVGVMWKLITPPRELHAFFRRKDSRVVFTIDDEKIADGKIVEIVPAFGKDNSPIGKDRIDYVDELFDTAEQAILSLGR